MKAKGNAYNAAQATRARKRRAKMRALQRKGKSLAWIGRRFGGVSRQTVWKILNRG